MARLTSVVCEVVGVARRSRVGSDADNNENDGDDKTGNHDGNGHYGHDNNTVDGNNDYDADGNNAHAYGKYNENHFIIIFGLFRNKVI